MAIYTEHESDTELYDAVLLRGYEDKLTRSKISGWAPFCYFYLIYGKPGIGKSEIMMQHLSRFKGNKAYLITGIEKENLETIFRLRDFTMVIDHAGGGDVTPFLEMAKEKLPGKKNRHWRTFFITNNKEIASGIEKCFESFQEKTGRADDGIIMRAFTVHENNDFGMRYLDNRNFTFGGTGEERGSDGTLYKGREELTTIKF